jgi:hypothetical protein
MAGLAALHGPGAVRLSRRDRHRHQWRGAMAAAPRIGAWSRPCRTAIGAPRPSSPGCGRPASSPRWARARRQARRSGTATPLTLSDPGRPRPPRGMYGSRCDEGAVFPDYCLLARRLAQMAAQAAIAAAAAMEVRIILACVQPGRQGGGARKRRRPAHCAFQLSSSAPYSATGIASLS